MNMAVNNKSTDKGCAASPIRKPKGARAMKKSILAMILVFVMAFSLAVPGYAEESTAQEEVEYYIARSGMLGGTNVRPFPDEYLDMPEFQGVEGGAQLSSVGRMFDGVPDSAAKELTALTGITINWYVMDKPENGANAEEEIDWYIENQFADHYDYLDGRTEPAADQVFLLCTEEPKETAFRAGEDVYDVFPEEVLLEAADTIDSAEDELMSQRIYRGIRYLFDYAIEELKVDYLPYSRAGEYAHHPDVDLGVSVYGPNVMFGNREFGNGPRTAEEYLEGRSIIYLLSSLYTYSGAIVYMVDLTPADEAEWGGETYETAEEQAQYYLDWRPGGEIFTRSDYFRDKLTGVAVIYDTADGGGAIKLDDNVQDLLTDEDITTILSAFTEGDTEYDKVLSGTKQLIKCVFDSGEFEYPEESVIADVINGTYDNEGLDTMKLTIIIGGAVFAIAAIAAVIVTVRQRKKRKE